MTQDVFNDRFLTQLPTPLAQVYFRAGQGSARARRDHLLILLEAILKFAVVPAALEYSRRLKANELYRNPAVDRELQKLKRPSMGSYTSMLHVLAKHFKPGAQRHGHPLESLVSCVKDKHKDRVGMLNLYRRLKNGIDSPISGEQSCSAIDMFTVFVAGFRNRIAHATGDRGDSFFAEIVPLVFAAVNDLLEIVINGTYREQGCSLSLVRQIRVKDENHVEVDFLPLVGIQPRNVTVTRIVKKSQVDDITPRSLAFVWPDPMIPVPASPLLIFEKTNKHRRPLMINRFDAKKPVYGCMETGTEIASDDLAPQVTRFFSQFSPTTHSKPARVAVDAGLLPYMVNREAQERTIRKTLDIEMSRDNPRAVLFILSGDTKQCHERFKSRMIEYTLLKHFRVRGDDLIEHAKVPFPLSDRSWEEFDDNMSYELGDKFSMARSGKTEIAHELVKRSLLIYSGFSTSDWCSLRARQAEWFLKYWNELYATRSARPPIICLGIKYTPSPSGLLNRFLSVDRAAQAREWLSSLDTHRYEHLRVEVIPEFSNVQRDDVENWRAKFDAELSSFPKVQTLDAELDRLFKASKDLPMQELAPELDKLLQHGRAA